MSISRLIQMGTAGVSAGGGGVVWTDPDLASASYDSVSLDVSTQESTPNNVFFKPDGTKMYVLGQGDDEVNEYDLSSAWDISTASHNQNFSVAGQEVIPTGISFKPDGSKMFIVGFNDVEVLEYSLSTSWDISSASYTQAFSVSSQDGTPMDLAFNTDGSKMFIAGFANDTVFEYDLSTAFDISTASYSGNSFSTASQEDQLRGLAFNPDGNKMYVSGSANDTVFEYDLSTNYDVSSASYNNVSFSVSSQTTSPSGLFFKSDGSKMYIVDIPSDTIYQYSTPAAVAWTDPDIANASYDSVSFSVATQEPAPSGIFFKPDGTKMYICGTTGSSSQKVNEYDLSTAWNPSTATHNQGLNVSSLGASEATPQGIFFKDDGTKMFIVGNTGDAVHEYTLSTAWDISSGSFVDSTTVSGQTTNPVSLCFKSDGTRLYTIALFGSQLYQYDLSTAWDASTLSYNNVVFDLDDPVNASAAKEISFNPDGTKMWAMFDGGDRIAEYDLSTAWDVSSASYNSTVGVVSFSQETTPQALFFKSDGSKMYIVGTASDTVYQYST